MEVWKLHCVSNTPPSLLSNEVGSTPWPDNIWDTSDQRRSCGGCNSIAGFVYLYSTDNIWR